MLLRRLLESFQGILFLTTTKNNFDESFRSHLDLTVGYGKLSSQALSEIWKYLVKTNENIDTDLSWNDEVYSELGKLTVNVS